VQTKEFDTHRPAMCSKYFRNFWISKRVPKRDQRCCCCCCCC